MLPEDNLLELKLLRRETHLALPPLTSLVLVKEIHDVLYQYLVDLEKERLLNLFLERLQKYLSLDRDGNGPFSVPLDELRFLEEEGLQELKFMNWLEIPVYVFEVAGSVSPDEEKYPEYREILTRILDELLVYNWVPGTNHIYVYPQGVV